MDIGISTVLYADFNHAGRDPDLFAALKKLAKLGYRQIEYNDQSVPQPQALTASAIKQVARTVNDLGLHIQSIHVPSPQLPGGDIGSRDPALRTRCLDIVKRTLDAGRILNVPYAVLHPGGAKENLPDPAVREQVRQTYYESLAKLCEDCRGTSVRLALENGGSPLSTIAALLAACRQVNPERLHICIDTGHAWGMGFDPAEMIRSAGTQLGHLHIHDTVAQQDAHLIPGEGRIDWAQVLGALVAVRYQGVFMLEAAFSRKTDDPDQVALRARQLSIQLLQAQTPAK